MMMIRDEPLLILAWKPRECNTNKWITSVFNTFRTARRMRSIGRSFSVLAAAIRWCTTSSLGLVGGNRGQTPGEVGSCGGRCTVQTAAVVCGGTVWRRHGVTPGKVGTESGINTVRTAAVRRRIARNWQQPTIHWSNFRYTLDLSRLPGNSKRRICLSWFFVKKCKITQKRLQLLS